MILMTLNKKLITLLIVISLLLIIPASFAIEIDENADISINNDDIILDSNELTQNSNAIYVNASGGSSNGTGSIDDPVSTIEDGLSLAGEGGTIYLTGEFIGEGNSNITLEGTPNNINFIGVGNAVINGNGTTSFAVVNNGTYSFSSISFINNYKMGDNNTYGGVFANENGKVTFDNCLFENNTIFSINRANGGAIDNFGVMNVTNCIFKNNIANVSNSSGFRKNAADGGAISNLGTLYVTNTAFIENKALRNGGAIRAQDGAETHIDKCNFTGNVAAYHLSGGSYGGAIYTWDCDLDLQNSIFKNNRVYDASGYGARGGAISANRGTNTLYIKFCEFINNTADGVMTVDGQSLYFEGVVADVNYCTIDTGVYSSSRQVNLDYNWWVVNNTNINGLIEMFPSKINTFAELRVISDVNGDVKPGETVNLTVKLCWNGTEKPIIGIPTRTVYLDSNCGILANTNGTLENGVFKTTLTITSTSNPFITANVDNVIVNYTFTAAPAANITELSATNDEIFEGENAVILISADQNENGICLIDVGDYKLYAKLLNGEANITIPNLKAGTYDVSIKYLGNNFDEEKNITATIIVKEKNQTTRLNTTIRLDPKLTYQATDYYAGERGKMFYAYLTDSNGNPLANKTIQIAANNKVYNVTTDSKGKAGIRVNIIAANTYSYAVSFQGDNSYNASTLALSKLTVTKKSTSIKASAKTFKAKAKTKKISVTLKTVKSKADSKVYLKKGKKITLKVKGKTYTAKTNAKGVAKFSIKITKKGKYTAKIKFAGDKTYKASSKTIKITIK